MNSMIFIGILSIFIIGIILVKIAWRYGCKFLEAPELKMIQLICNWMILFFSIMLIETITQEITVYLFYTNKEIWYIWIRISFIININSLISWLIMGGYVLIKSYTLFSDEKKEAKKEKC